MRCTSNGLLNLESKISGLKLVFKNATFESIEALEDRILELEQHEVFAALTSSLRKP